MSCPPNVVPVEWDPAFALVDEIWVYSRYVAEQLARVAPVPVVTVPPPVAAPAPGPGGPGLELPAGFRFLCSFDYFSTLERKNPLGAVEAFRRAFAPGEGPQLVLKTVNAPYSPRDVDRLRWAVGDRPDIHLVDAALPRAERDALLAGCDCYVSLHRAEGFGLVPAECMALGKPVIATGYSGNLDFMTPRNAYLVGYELRRIGEAAGPYPPEGRWAEPDLEHAAALMRTVVDDPAAAAARGARAARDIAERLSPAAAGAIARARIERILAGRAAA
jgi:glycosyltransferase involved in cell wall biosynthesis